MVSKQNQVFPPPFPVPLRAATISEKDAVSYVCLQLHVLYSGEEDGIIFTRFTRKSLRDGHNKWTTLSGGRGGERARAVNRRDDLTAEKGQEGRKKGGRGQLRRRTTDETDESMHGAKSLNPLGSLIHPVNALTT